MIEEINKEVEKMINENIENCPECKTKRIKVKDKLKCIKCGIEVTKI